MNSGKQLKIGAVLSYLSIFINIAVGLLYTPWMVEQIGQSQYGIYTLANSLITFFLVDFGLSAATSRYLSKYRAEGDTERAEYFLGAIYKLYLLITAVMFAVLLVIYFFIDLIYAKLTPTEIEQFKVVYIIAATFSVINFPFITFNGILTSYEKFVQLKLADIIYRVILVGSTVAALLLGGGLYTLVSLHAASGLVVIAFKYAVIKRGVPLRVRFRGTEKGLYREIFSFSIWATVDSLAQRLIFNVTPSILGIVANTANIAVFGIVTTIESYSYMVTAAINGMFLPRISQLIVDDESKLTPLLLKVGKYLYALNGLIVAGFAVLGRSFLDLWMGEGYEDAYIGILLVIIPGLFYNSLQIANTTMIAKKKVNIRAFVSVGIGVLNVALSFLLSWQLGVIGACLSIFIAYMVRAVALNVIYHKILPFNMIEFAKRCYLRMSLPIILTVCVGFLLGLLIPDGGWLIFCLKGVIVTAVYLAFTCLIGLNGAERRALMDGVRNKLQRK